MAEVISVFAIIAALVILGFLAEILFRKTRIPDVLLLIGAGILIATGFGWASIESFGFGAQLFTTFALVFILFQGALNIDFRALFHSFGGTVKLTLVSFILTVVGVALMGKFLISLPWPQSILLGTILGGTSSAVIIPLVQNLTLKGKFKLISMLESALSDVLCIVGAITAIAIIKTGQISASGIVKSVLSSFSMALIIGAIAGLIWMLILSRSKTLAESYMVTVAIVIGLYAFVESPFVEASGAISALAFGIILGNSKAILSWFTKNNGKDAVVKSVLSISAKNFYAEISFFVKVFFFIYLGILMDFSKPMIFVYAGLITLGIYLIRPLAVGIAMIGTEIDGKSRASLEVLVPKGLAAAVLAQLAVQQNVPNAEIIFDFVLGVILVSIIATSILAFLTEKNSFRGFYAFLRRRERIKEKVRQMLQNYEQQSPLEEEWGNRLLLKG